MKNLMVASGITALTVLGSVNINIQPARADYSRCAQNPSSSCFRLGDRGPLIYRFIEDLRCAGYYSVSNDSYYGPVTARSVTNFQRDFNLPADGIAGYATRELIKKKCLNKLNSGNSKVKIKFEGLATVPDSQYFKGVYYLIKNGTRSWACNRKTFRYFGFAQNDAVALTSEEFSRYTLVKPTCVNNSLLRHSQTGKVYLVQNGRKRWVTNFAFARLKLNPSDITTVSFQLLDQIPEGDILR